MKTTQETQDIKKKKLRQKEAKKTHSESSSRELCGGTKFIRWVHWSFHKWAQEDVEFEWHGGERKAPKLSGASTRDCTEVLGSTSWEGMTKHRIVKF